MDTINKSELPAIGSPLLGGFYAGLFLLAGELQALIVAPKEIGQHNKVVWGEYGKSIAATSCIDGHINTRALEEAGNEAAIQIRAMAVAGNDEGLWYIPSRDELEICYRNLKPTTTENYCSFRDGDNTSSVPVGELYTEESPAQTSVELFKSAAAEAFDAAWYWSSTQCSASYAYFQAFNDGSQLIDLKGTDFRVRAVRRLSVIQ